MAGEVDDTKDTYTIVHGDNADEEDANDDNADSDDDSGLSSDEIYSDDYVLGQKKGDGKLNDLINVDNYIATLSAFEVLWAIIMLAFAILGGMILVLYPGTIFWNAVKKIIASKGENPEHAVAEIKKINNKDMALTTGIGLSLALVAIAMFIFSLA